MMGNQFSTEEALKFGWETFKSKFWFLMGIGLTVMCIQLLPDFLAGTVKESSTFLAGVVSVIGWAISVVIQIGMIRILLKICDEQPVEFGELFSGINLFWQFVGASILYALIVMGGILLLVVPGIIWGIRYQFATYAVIDNEMGPIQALKHSTVLTNGIKGKLFVLSLCLGGINLLVGCYWV